MPVRELSSQAQQLQEGMSFFKTGADSTYTNRQGDLMLEETMESKIFKQKQLEQSSSFHIEYDG